MKPDDVLDVSWEDRVCNVTLNRPDKLNALDLRVFSRLLDVQRELHDRDDVRVMTLRGAGRAFSAGADLHYIDSIYDDPGQTRHYLTTLRDAAMGLERLPQPVVAGVHGMVLAGGLELMLACDLIVAGETTKIGDQHMNWGFIPGGGSTQRLPRWIGPARARDLLYTGRWVDATEAWDMGLVSRVVDDGRVVEAVDELATDLATRSPAALARTKALVREGLDMPLEHGLNLEIEAVMSYYAHDAFELAIEGFKSRTPPEFP